MFWTHHIPSIHKRARLLWRLWVIGWYSVQVTCDVELQERWVMDLLNTRLKDSPSQAEPRRRPGYGT